MIKKPVLLSLCLLLALSIVPAGPMQAGQGGDRPIEEERDRPEGQTMLAVQVEQVHVDVTVRDRRDNLIQGLRKEHFKVYEDGVEQEIVNFTPVEAPITAVMITEYSNVIPFEMLYESWLASHVFVDQLARDDWIAIVAYDLRPEILVDFTQNKMEAFNALRRLTYPAFRESNLYDTLYEFLDRLEDVDGKTAIILISSGLDTLSRKNLNQALEKVKNSNTVIYPVSLGGNLRARAEHRMGDMTRMDLLQADAFLRYSARYSGGEAFFPRFTQSFPGIFQSITALLRHQYRVSYVSNNPNKDGKFRKIKVEVTADVTGDGSPDRFKINHREGYTAHEARAD